MSSTMISRILAVGLAAVGLAAGCVPASPPNQPPTSGTLTLKPEDVLDHFICYWIRERQFTGPQNIAVIDQFYASPAGPVQVVDRRYLCNPTDKFRQGQLPNLRKHPESHLVCYGLQPVKRGGPLSLSNQFDDDGAQPVDLIESHVLCLPSGKTAADGRPPPIPKDLDHFKCYAVDSNVSGTARLGVHDQFADTPATVYLQPLLVCNPAEKVLNGKQEGPMLHNFAHLVCYSIDFDNDMDPQRVLITNQFERKGVVVTVWPERFLCAPSTKQAL